MNDLTAIFDECRKLPNHEDLETLRLHYFIDASMNEKEDVSSLRVMQTPSIQAVKDKKQRDKQFQENILIILNNRLADIENRLIDKYGEYFAENLAAEHLDDETYKLLMTIDDQNERREQIAKMINDGIEEGTIDLDAINENPDLKEWLEVRKELELNINSQEIENSNSVEFETKTESRFDAVFSK